MFILYAYQVINKQLKIVEQDSKFHTKLKSKRSSERQCLKIAICKSQVDKMMFPESPLHFHFMICRSKNRHASSNTKQKTQACIGLTNQTDNEQTLNPQNALLIIFAFLVLDHGMHLHDLCPWHLQQHLLVHSQTTHVKQTIKISCITEVSQNKSIQLVDITYF